MITLTFDIHTYWHIGTGHGDAAIADAVVARDASGLPYLPGRAVKGLLRAAADLAVRAGHWAESDVHALFGKPLPAPPPSASTDSDDSDALLEGGRFTPGGDSPLVFSSASLPQAWRDWAASSSGEDPTSVINALFARLASTKIDKDGVASDATLRVMEVTVPMTLTATVRPLERSPKGWESRLIELCPFVRTLGADRNRGLGRVTVTGKVSQ